MNIYAILSLCASGICISLAVSVFLLNRKSTVNRIFVLTLLVNSYWSFSEFLIRQATILEEAILWNRVLSFWPFFVALMLHFTLAFTSSSLLKKKLIYPAIYLPALFFSIVDLTTDLITTTPELKYWGYTSIPSSSFLANIDGVWAAAVALSTVFLFTNHYFATNDKTLKRQTKFVGIGFAVPVILSILTDSLFPVMNIDFPGLGNFSSSILAVIVAYAIVKHDLFSINPEIAAEKLFSTIPDSIVLVDLNGKIMKVNRSLIEMTGYSEAELVGKTVGEMLQKANVLNKSNEAPSLMKALIKIREVRNYEIVFYSKSGERKNVVLSCSMVSNNNNEDVGITFVLHDITDMKVMENKLIKAERLASIGELAGIIGHDLRNPLTGIRGATYYLKTKYNKILDNKDKVMFETIDRSIEYSNKIVNDLIDYSSEVKLELDNTTPKKLVDSVLALITPPLNIKFKIETQDAPEFQVDVNKIRQGFLNIIKNSLEAMPNGGQLSLKTEKIDENLLFHFIDNGLGMSEETLSKLWSPLFTTKAKGMGFGLAIAKKTVEAHEGKITAESALEQGTKITIQLPSKLKSKTRSFSMLLDEYPKALAKAD